jgi:hypothetical protein
MLTAKNKVQSRDMGVHGQYGKRVMFAAFGAAWTDWGPSVEISYGAGRPAQVDGTIGRTIAVEIESCVDKQIRGSLLDLICHPFPKKLLILQDVNMHDVTTSTNQCRNILGRFLQKQDFRVVVMKGHGREDQLNEDVEIMRKAVAELEIAVAAEQGGTI